MVLLAATSERWEQDVPLRDGRAQVGSMSTVDNSGLRTIPVGHEPKVASRPASSWPRTGASAGCLDFLEVATATLREPVAELAAVG